VGAEILAVADRVVAVEQVERAGIVAEGLEGEGCEGGVVFSASDGSGLFADLVFHGCFLHAPEAELAPLGRGHLLHEKVFHRGFGLELVFEVGEEAMLQGVAARVSLAFGRDGPAGFGSVGTGGLDLTFSSHFDFVIACEISDPSRLWGKSVDFRGNIKSYGARPMKSLWATARLESVRATTLPMTHGGIRPAERRRPIGKYYTKSKPGIVAIPRGATRDGHRLRDFAKKRIIIEAIDTILLSVAGLKTSRRSRGSTASIVF
jgi:hypothetical protein